MNSAVFLDRDGVINRKAPEDQYVTSWEGMHFLPKVAEAISLLNRAGFRVIVVSNQCCVAKGLLSAAVLESMHHRMRATLAARGAKIHGVYYCPHDKRAPCFCRKPEPGMLLAAAHEHHIDLSASWMIGDSETDIQAGLNAGCRTARVHNNIQAGLYPSDVVASSLLDAVRKVLSWHRFPCG